MTPMVSLKAYERLKSKKDIDLLFETGQERFVYPLKLIYLIREKTDDAWPLKFGISVPKKKLNKAVHRNLIKRRCREAYRLNKSSLQDFISSQDKQLIMLFIYLESELKEYDLIEKSIKKQLNALLSEISS